MGCDGKTGETLLKSVLAPMFAQRHLDVMSWVGHNIFGNMDGQILNDPVNKQSKVASKNRLLGEILGYQPQTLVSIEYIQSLGDNISVAMMNGKDGTISNLGNMTLDPSLCFVLGDFNMDGIVDIALAHRK